MKSRFWLLLTGYWLLAASCTEHQSNTVSLLPEPKMPQLGERLQKLNSRYKIRFLPDGYPGKLLEDNTIYPHPLYGNYVLNDYLSQYKKEEKKELYDAILKVADAAISRMTEKDSALIFWYEPYKKFRYDEPFYSGLAQSSYLVPMYKVYQLSGDEKYKQASEKILNSLMVPIEENGIFLNYNGIVSIEEKPEEPPTVILNGWLSALASIKRYYNLSSSEKALKLLTVSLKTLPGILYKYDCEPYKNTRYLLSGYQQFRMAIEEEDELEIQSIKIKNTETYIYELEAKNKSERHNYHNYLRAEDVEKSENGYAPLANHVHFNVVMSRLSFPKKNVLYIDVYNQEENNTLELQRLKYHFSAKKGVVNNKEWLIDTTLILQQGKHHLEIPLYWEKFPLVGYPTTFKKLGDEFYNVYHFIHINRLKQLNQLAQNDTIDYYINKWEKYTSQWPKMEIYEGLNHHAYK